MSDFEYSCYCEFGGGDAPEWMHSHMRTARKQHQCCECHDTIPIGSKFEYTSGKWDGQIKAFKTCAYCAALRDKLMAKIKDGIAFGELGCLAMAYVEIEP